MASCGTVRGVCPVAASGSRADVKRLRSSSARPSFDVVESKLRPPAARRGIVARTALVDRVAADIPPAVISVVAPAGYGKTTFLSQFAERRQSQVAWVSLDASDNDPAVLLTYIAMALDRVEAIDPRLFRALVSSGAGIEVPRRLVAAMATMRNTVALVIDNLDAVTSRESLDALTALALGLPIGWNLAIGSRDVLPLPTARLRGAWRPRGDRGRRSGDGAERGGPLLLAAGVEFADAELAELVHRTEGWPVGLYLAALAVNAGGSPKGPGATLSGDDDYIGDYLRSEILDRVSPADASFLTQTSTLDRMCGPLCDAVLGITGSTATLDRLQRRNLLVIPLDRRREWYRYHQLFRDLLLSELRRNDPGVVPDLHRRAATWCEANGMPENALDHAQAAGDADTAARLLVQLCNPVWASGRNDTVRRWMEWFEANDLIGRHPEIAVCGALQFAVDGRPAAAERWADAAEAISVAGVLNDGSTIEGMVAYLRANLCRNGPEAMRRDAQVACRGLSPTSPFRCNMIQVEGLSHLLEGDLGRADAFLARAVDEADRLSMRPFAALLFADRASVAIERDDWAAAGTFAEQALTILRGGEFDGYWTSAFAYGLAARVAAARGDPEQGRQLVTRAARLRPLLTYALPVVSVRALLAMAHAYVALADPGGARAVLRQANDIFQQRPALGNLPQQADELRAKIETIRAESVGASSLTSAELRLVPLLQTHLSFREIGERLYVSRHTVKTQALSIYRRLGVSSRSAAIDRLHELGLFEHA